MNEKIIRRITETNGIKKDSWYFKEKTADGKFVLRRCKNCQTQEEAERFYEEFIKRRNEEFKIKNITEGMFEENGEHSKRLEEFGHYLAKGTLGQYRQMTCEIKRKFGERRLDSITVREIEKYLLSDKKHSNSWKNLYLQLFGKIYEESIWKCPYPVNKPYFQKFVIRRNKADVLSTEELKRFFNPEIWKGYDREYVFFCLRQAAD